MINENITVFCTNMLDSNTAFGMRADNGEQVFIPANVACRAGIKVGDTLTATIIPNHRQPDKTPWFAVFISPVGEPLPEVPKSAVEPVSLDDRIFAAITKHGAAYHTTAEVADMVAVDTTSASNALNRLFKQARLARADVHAKPDQQRPPFCLWALYATCFVDSE